MEIHLILFNCKRAMKFRGSVLRGKSMRRLFRKAGYLVYLVWEFRTSCKCSNCQSVDEGNCEKFKIIPNPKQYTLPLEQRDKVECHGLLKCDTCGILWNRDENSARNIYRIAKLAVERKARPEYLCYQEKNEDNENVENKNGKSSSESNPEANVEKVLNTSKVSKKSSNKITTDEVVKKKRGRPKKT